MHLSRSSRLQEPHEETAPRLRSPDFRLDDSLKVSLELTARVAVASQELQTSENERRQRDAWSRLHVDALPDRFDHISSQLEFSCLRRPHRLEFSVSSELVRKRPRR